VSRPAPSHRSGAKAKAAKAKGKASKSTVKGRAGSKASGVKVRSLERKPTRGPARRRSQGKHRAPPSPLLRRRRFIVVASAAFATLVLGTSFPASGLLSDHRQLAATNAAALNLRAENKALAQERQQLNSKAEIHSLARQDYQLVDPGQTAYNVLPTTSQANKNGSSDVTGDPGGQPVVAPANAAGMSPDPDVPTTSAPSPAATSARASASSGSGSTSTMPSTQATRSSGGFWSRTLQSLEFWR
jgi:cell division protein FtsB